MNLTVRPHLFIEQPFFALTQLPITVCEGVLRGENGTTGNVGSAFFKKHFVVFDYGEPAVLYSLRT